MTGSFNKWNGRTPRVNKWNGKITNVDTWKDRTARVKNETRTARFKNGTVGQPGQTCALHEKAFSILTINFRILQ